MEGSWQIPINGLESRWQSYLPGGWAIGAFWTRTTFGAYDENVSDKVVRIVQSYVGVVNKMVWRKG